MIRNPETETLAFGSDDEFYRRLGAFRCLCLKRIRVVLWIILSIPCNCWSFFKYLTSSIGEIFIRKYIAVIVLALSASILPTSIVILRGDERIITSIYCLQFIVSSSLSLFSKRGMVIFAYKSKSRQLEHQLLLAQFNQYNRQEDDQPAGHNGKDKRQRLRRTLENLMEPIKGAFLECEGDPKFDFHRSDSRAPLNCSDESSAGPSQDPECMNCFTITNNSDDSYDSDEYPQRLSIARISLDAVKAFGLPVQVLGTDTYRVLAHSSDENCFSDESVDAEEKVFEAPVEVHHSDSHSTFNSCNDGSAESALMANYKNEEMVGSLSLSNLLHVDESSEPTCSNFQNDVKEEESAQT